ncbi:hypothetical protein [Planotetraspora kaengkrachanensis]|uniref:Uncharacterized protein n=1 Tax=Planotetraspora kaengkrachanensis TaxID=575193 RepID=A0A8J3PWQ8_9ACTN|nr:hypothetical protein [Planotetraspora kaengkrachanensis]GIG82478.1 hypothetical protein Pka01_56050 [Planotetraspora kaengkrachanensis]
MLKKLIATGIVAAAATGVMLLGGPANADRLSVNRTAVPATYPVHCYSGLGYYKPTWCRNYRPTTYYRPTTHYQPATYYPGHHHGWDRDDRWHHRDGWNR